MTDPPRTLLQRKYGLWSQGLCSDRSLSLSHFGPPWKICFLSMGLCFFILKKRGGLE